MREYGRSEQAYLTGHSRWSTIQQSFLKFLDHQIMRTRNMSSPHLLTILRNVLSIHTTMPNTGKTSTLAVADSGPIVEAPQHPPQRLNLRRNRPDDEIK